MATETRSRVPRKQQMESWFQCCCRWTIQSLGIKGKPWTGAIPDSYHEWIDFLFLPHEYQNYKGWITLAAPADWAEYLAAVCRGETYVRHGHSVRHLIRNIALFIAAHRLNKTRREMINHA